MQYSRNKSAVEMLNRQKELYEEYMGRGHAVKAMQNYLCADFQMY
jgi:hypothetical protein